MPRSRCSGTREFTSDILKMFLMWLPHVMFRGSTGSVGEHLNGLIDFLNMHFSGTDEPSAPTSSQQVILGSASTYSLSCARRCALCCVNVP